MNVKDNGRKKKKAIDVSNGMMTMSSLLMAAVVIIFGLISYLVAKIKTETDSQVTMYNASNVISGIVSDYMQEKVSAVKNMAIDESVVNYLNDLGDAKMHSEAAASEGYEEIQSYLNDIVLSNSDVVSAWVVSEKSGMLVADNGRYVDSADFDVYNRYWYRDMANKSIICTSAAGSVFDSSIEVVSVIIPVSVNGNVLGYAAIEIGVNSISRIMNQYTLNSGCYPIISCDYGTVIYQPSSSEFRNKFNVSQMPLLNVLIQAPSLSDGLDSYSQGINRQIYFNIDNSTVPGWSIIVLFDSEVLNGGIYSFFCIEMIILVCLVLIMAIVLKSKLKSSTMVLPKLYESVNEIAKGNYKYAIDTAYAEENGLLGMAEKLNSIADSLNEKTEIIKGYMSRDTLTGLPNRMRLYEKIDELVQRNSSENATSDNNRFAVMFVDIDNFKWLNETLGHNFGDAVLCTFAGVLSSSLTRYGTVYRFSGDEFIILVEFGNDYNKIQEVVDILQKAFSKQIKIMTDNIYIKFSIGVSIYPDDDITADMLLRDADLALHRAKDGGKDRVSFYTNAVKRQNFSKAMIAQQISSALRDNEMYLNYQPIICADSCDIHGFEVLLRWNSATYGNIPPADFITVAEETGEIVQIGTWIFESACRFLKLLSDNCRHDIIMSINVSPVQLKRADYLEHIQRVIEITQINPANIQLEITESTLIDFLDTNDSVFQKINDMGISIALDDFGTGYSSLNYLKNFPIKCLKIDKSFVDEINNNKRDYAITDSIIDLVHNLGIKTVAEGIETVGQYNFLRDMKCDYIQGFLMSKPLDENDALEFVEKYDALHKPDSAVLAEHEKQLADEKKKRAENSTSENDGVAPVASMLVDGFISK
ncbi:MAG: EAL domain-containing protein [Oscillospiraceae bacterium]|nr:EAL domain-containing protein [Oscillospiraceae bacterium]